MKKELIITTDPKEFLNKSGEYIFPFEVLDSTPGGSNLGRIMWCAEFHSRKKTKNTRRIGELWVWARQTRDEKYKGKIFKIETYAECFTTDSSLRAEDAFIPWRVQFCNEHKGSFILDAYPKNHHKELVIDNSSSISVDINFK